MPMYSYRCQECDEHKDVFRSVSAIAPPPSCDGCGASNFARVFTAPYVKEVEYRDYAKERRLMEEGMKTPGISPATKRDIDMAEHNASATRRAREKEFDAKLLRSAERNYQAASRGYAGRINSASR